MMRCTAQKASNWYLHTHKEDKDLTVEDIREMIEAGDAAGLAQRVSHAGVKRQDPSLFGKVLKRILLHRFEHQILVPLMFFLPVALQIFSSLIHISICLTMTQRLQKMLHHTVQG
jgi:hypothetical protein